MTRTLGHDPEEYYAGPAHIGSTEVMVHLRGYFQPIDGRFHWWGRLAAHPDLEAHGSGSTVTVRTAYGAAEGRLSDLDPWGRFRITGTGRPPF